MSTPNPTVAIALNMHEARALARAAEFMRDVFADAHLPVEENTLATAHLRLLSAIEQAERFDHACGQGRM